MYEVKKETLKHAFKPYDVVTNSNGDVGFVKEVSVNDGQKTPNSQISYSVRWIVGDETKCAWFDHYELTRHTNLFIEIAEASCHPHGNGRNNVESLFENWSEK